MAFQDPPSKSSHPLSLVLSNWARKLIPRQWFNLSASPSCTDLFPALPGSWDRTFGPQGMCSRSLWNNSSAPCESDPDRSSFSLSMTPLSERRGRKSQDVLGIKIMLRRWPMSLVINGSSPLCSIRTSSCPLGPSSTIPKGLKDAATFARRLTWRKESLRSSDSLSLVNSTCWPIVGTGRKRWSKSVGRVAII